MVLKLTSNGISTEDIGIITPYALQVKFMKDVFNKGLKLPVQIGTVEEFQGQEKLVILLSTVRSCKDTVKLDVSHRLGFIHCPKRLNVAVSRAR